MYSKATYVKPYIRKFIRVLGINNVGTLNKPKMNVIYAILANNGIRPIDKNKYGVPLYQYRDLDGLNDLSIIAGFRKWKDDMLRKDIEISMRDGDQPKPEPRHRQVNTQMDIPFIDEEKHLNQGTHDDRYLENDFGEKWLKINNTKLFMEIESKIKSITNKSDMGLMELVKVEDDNDTRYIALIHGGLNGPGEWEDYFPDMCKVIKAIPGSWVIDLDVDVVDDVWTLYVGFRKKKLNEGASGYQPEDSDAYFDMCYDLSKLIFKEVLEHLEKNLKVKNDNMVYTYLGILNHMLQVDELDGPLHYSNKDLSDKKTDRLAVKIIKVVNKCYKYLLSDHENRQGWEDFEEYQRELEMQRKIFISNMKKLNDNTETPIKPYHLHEGRKKVIKNDKGEVVPEVCPECGSKVGLYIQGEPVYLCSNKKCRKYFGTMPFPKSLEKEMKEMDKEIEKKELQEKKMKKKIFVTENQMNYIKGNVNEGKFPVDPNKVLVVKKFLDDNFQKGGIASIGEDGYPKTISIVALKGTDGSLLKNMDDKQLFYMLQDKFQHLYDDAFKRDKLLKQIIKDWYKDKISKNGILTVNLI